MIKIGDRLGGIRDYRGAIVEQVVSPLGGYALYGLAGPPIKAGRRLSQIGIGKGASPGSRDVGRVA